MSIHQSYVGAVHDKVTNYIITNDQDKGVKRAAKIGAGIVAYPVLAVAFAVEAVVRGLLTLIAKMVHFFLPKDSDITRKFENKIFTPLYQSTKKNARNIIGSAAQSVVNFMKKESQKNAANKIESFFNAVFDNKVVNFINNAHINGIYRPNPDLN